MKSIRIELTAEQLEQLEPIIDLLHQADLEGKPGLLLAQVWPSWCVTGFMKVNFVKQKKAKRLFAVLKPGKKMIYCHPDEVEA